MRRRSWAYRPIEILIMCYLPSIFTTSSSAQPYLHRALFTVDGEAQPLVLKFGWSILGCVAIACNGQLLIAERLKSSAHWKSVVLFSDRAEQKCLRIENSCSLANANSEELRVSGGVHLMQPKSRLHITVDLKIDNFE